MLSSVRSRRRSAFAPDPGALDARDFSEVYRAYAARVSVWVRRLGGPQADCEDLMQEVFTVVLRRLDTFEPDRGDLGAWLYGITIKVVQGARRKRRVRDWLSKVFGPVAGEAEGHEEPTAEERMVANEARQQIYTWLERLPEAQRTAFILYELEELDGPAIAALTQTSLANVWVRVHRARRAMMEAARGTCTDDHVVKSPPAPGDKETQAGKAARKKEERS